MFGHQTLGCIPTKQLSPVATPNSNQFIAWAYWMDKVFKRILQFFRVLALATPKDTSQRLH